MNSFKDFNGTETKVGDNVVFVVPRYRELTYGTIISVSAKKARIKWFSWQWGMDEFQADHGIIVRALESHQNRNITKEIQDRHDEEMAKRLAANAKTAS